MSAPSPNADPERGEVPNTAAVVTRKWGTLRNFAANEEGRRKLNRAAAAPEGGRAKVLWGSLKDRVKVSEKVDPIEEKAEGLAERKPKYSMDRVSEGAFDLRILILWAVTFANVATANRACRAATEP